MRAWVLSLSRQVFELHDMPGPRSIGSVAMGLGMLQGDFKFGGRVVVAPGASIWDIRAPDDAFRVDMHSFVWLDNLAAVASAKSASVARLWVNQWIAKRGRGSGLAWSSDIVGMRQIRFVHHYDDLTRDMSAVDHKRFDAVLTRQARFLAKRWKKSPAGVPRIEALAALFLSARVMSDLNPPLAEMINSLRRQVARSVTADGEVESRNPQELLYLLTLLIWIRDDLTVMDRDTPAFLNETIAKIVPVLRSVRHFDGGLARMQGGGAGFDRGLDRALAASNVRGLKSDGAMGFARVTSGRTSVIVDAAKPAKADASFEAHASTLAIEVTSGRRPLIVSCGSGAPFGEDWRKAGRATPSHSVMGLDGSSSSRLGRTRDILGQKHEQMETRPSNIELHRERHLEYIRLEASHDGYLRSHGVLQGRALELTIDGSAVAGEDVLLSEDRRARAKFDKLIESARKGLAFTLRFHLHPDVEAAFDLELNAYRLTLKSGEVWVFRHDGSCKMALESSVYLSREAIRPTATKQIVLTGVAMSYATRIRWSLAKTPESLKGIRDLAEIEAVLSD